MYRSHYRILGLIGQGQFGRVFCAVDRKTGEIVALKDLEIKRFPTNKFLRELSYLLTLRHPNIVACTGLEYNRTGRYLVMDYCEGGTLRDLINSQAQISLRQKLSLVENILSGLSHAHSRQIIHCDIKPENILLKVKPSSWSAHISDFGIARLLEEINSESGGYTGSPAYMAPERFYGKHSFASDLYAVGIILFELLTGYRPFSGYPGELMTAHMSKSVTLPDTIPTVLGSIIEIALRKLPQRRFKSTDEMLKAVRIASKQLGFNSPSIALASSVTVSPELNIIAQFSLYQRVTHLAVSGELLYFERENTLSCQSYSQTSLLEGSQLKWQIELKGSLIQLFTYSQGCITLTKLSAEKDYLMSYFSPDNTFENKSKQTYLLNLVQISSIASGGDWLASTSYEESSQTETCLYIIKLSNLSIFKTSIICPLYSKLIILDSRHGLIIYLNPSKNNETVFKLFTRRGNIWDTFTLSLGLNLNSVTSNPYLPYYLFALEDTEAALGILINLKPLKITRIYLKIKPDFILGQSWGFVLASRQGLVILLNEQGEEIGSFEIEEKINAIASCYEFKLLITTYSEKKSMLYLVDLDAIIKSYASGKKTSTTLSLSLNN